LPAIEPHPEGVLLRIWAQPKASRTQVTGLHGEPPRLRIQIAAPPVDGAANEELLRFLKKALGIPASRIELIRGATSKHKDVLCRGLSAAEAQAVLVK
jgi:uncharacterized protein (TIGR00251 family)